MPDFYFLKSKARDEVYEYIDKNIRKLPHTSSGDFDELSGEFVNNDIDALRHAYVSGVYTMEFSEGIADFLGRLNELTNISSGSDLVNEEHMALYDYTMPKFSRVDQY